MFKEFGGVNAVPICLDTQDTEEIISTVVNVRSRFRRHQSGRYQRTPLL
ncbi:MAG: hypothetical protein ACLTLQ_12405 [[Clostridium] scindens]